MLINDFIAGFILGGFSFYGAGYLALRYIQTMGVRGAPDGQPLPFVGRDDQQQAALDQRIQHFDDVPGLGR